MINRVFAVLSFFSLGLASFEFGMEQKAYAEEVMRSFRFLNGASVVYSFDDKSPFPYQVEYMAPGHSYSNTRELHKGKGLSTFEFNDAENSPFIHLGSVPIGIEGTQKQLQNEKFTSFGDLAERRVIYQDGSIHKPCYASWDELQVQPFEFEGSRYVVETYGTGFKIDTFLHRAEDSKCIMLDSRRKEGQLQSPELKLSNSILSLSLVEAGVDLRSFCKVWAINPGRDAFLLESCEGDHYTKAATHLYRFRGNKKLKVSDEALPGPRTVDVPYHLEKGLLTILTGKPESGSKSEDAFRSKFSRRTRSVAFSSPSSLSLTSPSSGSGSGVLVPFSRARTVFSFLRGNESSQATSSSSDGVEQNSRVIDLGEFDAEVRRFAKSRDGEPVLGKNGQPIDAVEEVKKNYKDLVAEARKRPEDFPEKSDPIIMERLAEGVFSGTSSVILGTAGTGKSSAVKAFARDVSQGRIPGVPRTTQIFEVNMANLASGTVYTGMIQERIGILIAAAKKMRCIYFIDELHSISGIGTSKHQSNDVTQYLKKSIEDGDVVVIGATTEGEFAEHFKTDRAFRDRFEKIYLKPPVGQDLIETVKRRVEGEYGIEIDDQIVAKAIDLSTQLDLQTAQPRAAVRLLKKAVTRLLIAENQGNQVKLDIPFMEETAVLKYGIDASHFDRNKLLERLKELKRGLDREIIGHTAAKKALIEIWQRKLHNVGDPERVNSLFLIGPSGTGKTQLAKASARLMGYESTVIEMNKYSRGGNGVEDFRNEVYDALLRHPFRVIVLDEFEKAHPSVQEGALSMLQSGVFTVNPRNASLETTSMEVSAKNSIFIMTSNAGSQWIRWNSLRGEVQMTSELLERLPSFGIPEGIVSRLQFIVPVTLPTKEQFEKGISRFLDETLEREGQKRQMTFTLADREGFIRSIIEKHSPSCDYRDAKRVMLEVESYVTEVLSQIEPKEGTMIELKWNPDFQPILPETDENPLVS